MKNKRVWIILLAVVVIGFVGFGSFYIYKQRESPGGTQRVNQSMNPGTIPVQRGDISRVIESSGIISGARNAELSFSTSGKIQHIFVEVGDFVTEGQELAAMNDTQQELAFLRAKNAYDLAKISGTINAQREAELDLEVARTNLENTSIKAPFAGVVTAVNLEEGEHAAANSQIISLLDNSVFYADISVDELDMHQIKLGQSAIVKVDALGDQVLEGTISQIGMIAQSSGSITTVPVTIRIKDLPAELRVGYSASVIIEVARADGILLVPVEAVVRQGNQSLVTVIRGDETETIEVTTGITDGMRVEITSGLQPTDSVVAFNVGLFSSSRSSQSTRMPSVGTGIRIGGFGR